MKSKLPSWIPDWTNEKSYLSIDQGITRLRQLKPGEITKFAWQFLRRNPEYQSDYFKYQFPWDNLKESSYLQIIADLDEGNIPLSPFMVCDPPAQPKETMPQYLKRTLIAGSNVSTKYGYSIICEKYKIQNACHPAIDYPSIHFKTNNSPAMQIAHTESVESLAPWKLTNSSDAFIKIDLNIPIKIQLERARKALEARQRLGTKEGLYKPYNGKISVNLLPYYLRILDATTHGIKPNDIASILLPNEKNTYPDYLAKRKIEAALKRAVQIRDRDCMYFLLNHKR